MDHSIIKRLQITGIITRTKNAKTFILQPLDGWQPRYQAGQFLTLVFQTRSGEKRRSFSISSALAEPLAITVKKIDNGEFSRLLHYKATVGDILYSSGTGGFFILPADSANKQFFFLAAGSGITPCFALIKTLLATTNEQVVLIYSNRTKEDTIFYDELQELEKQYGQRFRVYYLFSVLNDIMKSRLSHWLLTQLLQQFLPVNKEKALFYICGPYDYMLMVIISLKANGMESRQLLREDFSPLPRPFIPRPPDTGSHQVTLHLNDTIYSVQVQYPQSITAAARAQGIRLPYSCEAGRCGSCVATCVSGTIWMAYNEVLLEEEIARGRVLTCTGFPVDGDAVIVY